MAEIAAAAGVSRQAVYLHFTDRAELLQALVRHADEIRGLERELRKMREAPDALAALRQTVAVQARINPGVWAAARAMDAIRHADAAAERGWSARQYEKHVTAVLLASLTNEAG